MTLFLGVVLIGAAVVLLGRSLGRQEPATGLTRSLEALENLNARPDATDLLAETEPPFADRVLAPLQERALAIGRRFTGADKTERIRHKLDLAGNPRDWSVDRVVSLKVLGAVVSPLLALSYGLVMDFGLSVVALVTLGGLVVGFYGPDLYLYQRSYNRSEEIRRTLADAVDLLTISVEAGLGFDAAVQHVARNTDGPLAEEFSRVLREMQLGKGRSESLKALAERTNVDDLKTFVGAMVQADAFGISIGQVLRVQSSEMRVKRRQYAETKAQQVPVKIMVPLIVCILPCLMVVVMGPAVLGIMKSFG
ncbi:type II secretion system F family protein [Nocardioides sp. TF02-7]|uniref:type II secretion system F family protein n=1 Tax=Nocardioides sp. TF02-7 TaxID=2917724 RepID=UPI001F05C849|nr:type II secretion system F family protein [Nocardioides sp. TF02-7]UMG92058.1 type II secretion system F family protein [Nocardioides sp. TF02-7]